MTHDLEPDIDALTTLIEWVYKAIRESLTHKHFNFYWNIGRKTLTAYQHIEVRGYQNTIGSNEIIGAWSGETGVDFFQYSFDYSVQDESPEAVLDELQAGTYKWLQNLGEGSERSEDRHA